MALDRHFSMMRTLRVADFLTLGNAACGSAGVFSALEFAASGDWRYFAAAVALAPAALVFDVLDGRVARWRRKQSLLGRELDSLADVISFGVAPATLALAVGMNGALDWVALIYFVCCGVGRLARFNVTAEQLSQGGATVAYFEGTPIPTSVVLTAVLAFAGWQGAIGEHLYGGVWRVGPLQLHPLVLLFVASGTMMISKTLRIPKL
ncbi:MAG TPA: CDP-alcohol phosphatidyltransferase family protein [Casimicrobiaceae bacterium]|nr:CDP-alcohol phosphatidyltransferase family protein [Casimicrobiaceae bacterium]